MTQNGLNYLDESLITEENKNKFLFNGKEKDAMTGFYEYGFRDYDAQLGRWHVRDPLAESYSSQSPYHFAGNNPINSAEINGAYYENFHAALDYHANFLADGTITRENAGGGYTNTFGRGTFNTGDPIGSFEERYEEDADGNWNRKKAERVNVLIIGTNADKDNAMNSILNAALEFGLILVIQADDAKDAADLLAERLKPGEIVGNVIFASHGRYLDPAFRVGDSEPYENPEAILNDKSLAKMAKYFDENSQIALTACHVGAEHNEGVYLLKALSTVFKTTVFGNQSWGTNHWGGKMFDGVNPYKVKLSTLEKRYDRIEYKHAFKNLGKWTKITYNKGTTATTVNNAYFTKSGGIRYNNPYF